MPVMWVRGPAWDGCWILSGFPLGVALILAGWALGIPPATMTIYLLVVFQTGHSLSPIALAWGHSGFRSGMLRNKSKYIVVPLFIVALTTACGLLSQQFFPEFAFIDDVSNRIIIGALWQPGVMASPIWWVLITYLVWNTYHFGMQNFGVMSIYRRVSGISYGGNQRLIDMVFCLGLQAAVFAALIADRHVPLIQVGYVLLMVGALFVLLREAAVTGRFFSPRIAFGLGHALSVMLFGPWLTAINGVNHWLTAIGLAGHVHGNHKQLSPIIFVMLVSAAGIVLFWLLYWKVGQFNWNLREMMQILLPAFGLRLGIGFTHFLYDRWVWKLSDPQVRATIGQDLLKQIEAEPCGHR